MGLPEELIKLREATQLTQDRFSRKLNTNKSAVIQWENGSSVPNIRSMKAIKRVCTLFNYPYDAIEEEWLKVSCESDNPIKYIRLKELLDQRAFAEILDVDVATVNRWEKRNRKPREYEAKKINKFCEERNLPPIEFDENKAKNKDINIADIEGFNNKFKALRMKECLSVKEFAAALNVSVSGVRQWENGVYVPQISEMKKILKFCTDHDIERDILLKEWLQLTCGENKFKRIRYSAFMTMRQFSSAVHVTMATINYWERGSRLPMPSTEQKLKDFCQEHGIPYDG